MGEYDSFLNVKAQLGGDHGFEPLWMPDQTFDFQAALIQWACLKGRAAIFADCGLGKSLMQLTWAENVVRKTNGKVLVATPLAVSYQTVEEGAKFGIEVKRSSDGTAHNGITVTNYERLKHFNCEDFAGVVCDESSILKSFTGSTKSLVTAFMRKIKYRLLCTATAAPNDYVELGTSSEALGYLGYPEMLSRFFVNTQNTMNPHRTGVAGTPHQHQEAKWRFKGHAEREFWKWVCSWARAVRKPSDIGFSDDRFILPPLSEKEHIVSIGPRPGSLFVVQAVGLKEQRDERRRTVEPRSERVGELVNGTGKPALVWCHLNVEGDALARAIPDSIQVSGSMTDEEKEDGLIGFAKGKYRVLITKPKIGAFGLNYQHCSHVTTFPSHSFEAYYQGVRRCWRFGQKNPVQVDIVTSDGERGVADNLRRKSHNADMMFSGIVREMSNELRIGNAREFGNKTEVPEWL